MTPHECGRLLAIAAKYDTRLGERTAEDTLLAMKAWSAALNPNMSYGYASDAIVAHYRHSKDKITPADISGGTFSISSLGGIGGTSFTPVVNAPEVAILGVVRSSLKPQWNGTEFVPRLMLPLCVSYDHRVIDGALAARFTRRLAEFLGDVRQLVL